MQDLQVEYFGLVYYEMKYQPARNTWGTLYSAGSEYIQYYGHDNDAKEYFDPKQPYKTKYHFFLALKFNSRIEKPVIFWRGQYQAEWCIKKIKSM